MDFDLLSDDNLFENLINAAEPNSLLDGEPAAKRRVIFTDHDYIAHNSPSEHSDSGISGVSDDSLSSHQIKFKTEENLTDDQLSMFVNNIRSDLTASPNSSCSDGQTFDFFDIVNTDSNLSPQLTHTVNTTTADLDDLDFNFNNEDVSIDFGKLCLFFYSAY